VARALDARGFATGRRSRRASSSSNRIHEIYHAPEAGGDARHVACLLRKVEKHDPRRTGSNLFQRRTVSEAFLSARAYFDKTTYSPWIGGELHRILSSEGVETVVLSGGETDVCVLAAALGAIDLGYRVVVLRDAVCSSADDTHNASLELLGDRFSVQLELVTTEAFLISL
jgi:nicotinamidase-related amidase